MRILHVVTHVDDQASYGGPLTVAIHQCRELRRRGHDARITAGWAGQGAPPQDVGGIPAHLHSLRNVVPGVRGSGVLAPELLSWLRANGSSFDAAHLHLSRDLVPLMAGFWLRRADVPYVTQTHGMMGPDDRVRSRALDRTLTVRVLRDANRRFVLTADEEKSICDVAGPLPMERLPAGISIFADDEPFTVPRRQGQALNVLCMSSLEPDQRVLDFARAAAELITHGSDARFSIAGPAGPDLPELQALIASDRRLRDNLIYEGPLPRDESMDRLAQADLYVVPSASAAGQVTLLEALTAATPAICTTECGIAPELEAAGAALVVDPGPAGLADGIRSLLTSPRRRTALSAAGPGTVRRRFSMIPVAEQLVRAYQRETTVVNLAGSDAPDQVITPEQDSEQVPLAGGWPFP